jgi:hypothetical protein
MAAPTALQITAQNLRIDALTAEVVRAFQAVEIPTILLKGPVVARLVYGDGTRPYVDTDLLVRPAEYGRAEELLAELGFTPSKEWGDVRGAAYYQRHWHRPDEDGNIDLHHTLYGAAVPAERVWEEVARETEPIVVGGVQVDGFGPAAATLHLALHAVYAEEEKPLLDLSRALERLDFEHWVAAARLAERLHAVPFLAAGLRLVDGGVALTGKLGLPEAVPLELRLRDLDAPRQAALLSHAFSTGGLRGGVTVAARVLVPRVAYMRSQFPLARRGRLGLGAAYALRPLRMARRSLPALIALRRARRGHA